MRILYVEDKMDFAELFAGSIVDRMPGTVVDISPSFNDALSKLQRHRYDVVLLDLAIPRDNAGTAHVVIGAELARHIAFEFAGTPIIVFTGQDDERETDDLQYEMLRRVRFMGGDEQPYLSRRRKDEVEKIQRTLSNLHAAEASALAINLSNITNGALGDECPDEDRRLLKAFCLFRKGHRGRVKRLGGLSGSAVYRIDVLARDNSIVQMAVGKLDSGSSIEHEQENYANLVTRLQGGFSHAIPSDLVAGGSKRGAFYSLASGFDADLFDRLHDSAADLIPVLRAKLASWHGNPVDAEVSIRSVVEEVAGARGLRLLLDLNIDGVADVLDMTTHCSRSVQHGDLHGSNVLCKANGSDVCLIDFGDVGEAVRTLDIVTLELSPFFHPSASTRDYVTAAKSIARDWFNEDTLRESGKCNWILELRRWGLETARDHLEYAAVVLGYATRQLKYDDTDHDFARTLIEAAVVQLRDR